MIRTEATGRAYDAREATHPRRGSGFGSVLKTVGIAAASAIPVVGPAIAAIVPSLGKRHSTLPGGIDPNAPSAALEYLELQRAIEEESRHFETASNVMKARHDASMAAIRNLKS